MARLDRCRIGIPRELSEIHIQPWLNEGSLTCDPSFNCAPIHACYRVILINKFLETFYIIRGAFWCVF